MELKQSSSPETLLKWIDETEKELAKIFSKSIEDKATLDMLAYSWRVGFHFFKNLPPHLQKTDLYTLTLPRGSANTPGTLGNDYPHQLFQTIKKSWSAAVGTLAVQESLLSFGFNQSKGLQELILALDQAKPPLFAPSPRKMSLEMKGFHLYQIHPDQEEGEPIFIIPPMFNRWYILDFLKDISFIENIKKLKRPVYLLEVLAPDGAPDDRLFTEICSQILHQSIDHICKKHSCSEVSLLGYCTGGTLAAMFTARYPHLISRLATICSPVRFSKAGLFSKWFSPQYVDIELVSEAYEHVPAWLVNLPFWWLSPTIKMTKLTHLCRSFAKAGYIDRFLALEVWNHDIMNLARGAFKTWVGELYQKDALATGTLIVDGEKINLQNVKCPLWVVTATYDSVVPPAAAEALLELSSSTTKKLIELKTSHVGAFTNARFFDLEIEELRNWLSAKTKN